MMADSFQNYLKSTQYFDYNAPIVREFAEENSNSQDTPTKMAVDLYIASRDKIRYNPYTFSRLEEHMSASYTLEHKQAYCIPKAVVLGALARYRGIPSRLGLADVTNHLSDEKLIKHLRSEIFVMHGFIELYLEGKWVKATPAFNATLCEHLGVAPLEFNGKEDSIFQEFDHDGKKFMEYLKDHGTFDDVPMDFIRSSLQAAYPHLFEKKS